MNDVLTHINQSCRLRRFLRWIHEFIWQWLISFRFGNVCSDSFKNSHAKLGISRLPQALHILPCSLKFLNTFLYIYMDFKIHKYHIFWDVFILLLFFFFVTLGLFEVAVKQPFSRSPRQSSTLKYSTLFPHHALASLPWAASQTVTLSFSFLNP